MIGPGIVLGPSFSGKRCLMADPEAIYNWRRLDYRITTSGQPTEKQLADIHALGVRHIVNLGLTRARRHCRMRRRASAVSA